MSDSHEADGPERVQMTVDEVLALAIERHKDHEFSVAEGLYRQILETLPDHPDANHFLGCLLHQTGRGKEGLEFIEKAIRLAPKNPAMQNNLGNILTELGRAEEALDSFRRVIRLLPNDFGAHNNLGVALKDLERYEEAEDAYRRAVSLKPDSADSHHNLGNVLLRLDRVEEAAACFRKAISLRPHDAKAYRRLGMALYSTGQIREAEAVFRQWVGFDPLNPTARYLLSACSGEDVPDRAGDEVVRQLFEDFAGSFDKKLADLDYQAPQLVMAALSTELPAPAADFDVLDAGCGTGLAAPMIKPFANRLVGIDLSMAMLDKARGLGLYDELMEVELTAFLESRPDSFDVVLSIDTLVYFGDLATVSNLVALALRPGGWFAFTVELDQEGAEGDTFRLNPHGRYTHTESYVRTVLDDAGLTVSSLSRGDLRSESQKPVVGLVVVARREV